MDDELAAAAAAERHTNTQHQKTKAEYATDSTTQQRDTQTGTRSRESIQQILMFSLNNNILVLFEVASCRKDSANLVSRVI